MRRRVTYANVVATLALVLAMSGGALAASHYLINSTKQINPKVLRKLRGARGPRGLQGPAGSSGSTGRTGAAGKQGPSGKEGKEGKEGAPGTPALATTAFVQMTFSSPILLELGNTLVLSTKTSGGGKNLTLSANAHALVDASLRVLNPGPERYELSCQLAYEGLAASEPTLFGTISETEIKAPGESAPEPIEIPLTGNVALAGDETYDLRVYCHSNAIKRLEVEAGALNAVA